MKYSVVLIRVREKSETRKSDALASDSSVLAPITEVATRGGPFTFGLAATGSSASAWEPAGQQLLGGISDNPLADKACIKVTLLVAGDLGRNGSPSGRMTLVGVST